MKQEEISKKKNIYKKIKIGPKVNLKIYNLKDKPKNLTTIFWSIINSTIYLSNKKSSSN